MTANNTIIVSGTDATFQCNSSLGPDSIAWSQSGTLSFGCNSGRSGYSVSCPASAYNQLRVLSPSAPDTYYCSDNANSGAKAAIVAILSRKAIFYRLLVQIGPNVSCLTDLQKVAVTQCFREGGCRLVMNSCVKLKHYDAEKRYLCRRDIYVEEISV